MPLLISQLPKAEIETKASIKPELVPEEGEVSQLWGSVQKSQVIIIKNMRMPLYSFKMTLYWHEGSFCHSTSPISTSLKCSTLFLWWSSKPFPSFCPCLWFPVVIAASFSGAFCSQVECALRYLKLGERTSRYKWTEMLWLWVAGWWVDWGVEVRWEGRESHLLKTQIALHETPSALLLWPSSLCTLHCPPQFFLTVFFSKFEQM